MAYYPTQDLQPITAGTAKPVVPDQSQPAHPASGYGCLPCAAAAAGLGSPIVAVSGLGDTSKVSGLLSSIAVGAAAVATVTYLAARASSAHARAGKYAKYGALFGAALGGFLFVRPDETPLPVVPSPVEPTQP